MSETLRRAFTARPTFEQQVPFSRASRITPPGPSELTALTAQIPPELGGGGGEPFSVSAPPQAPSQPITGTIPASVQGAPYALSAIADFLTALGAGVPAAQQQQARRQEGVQSLLNEQFRRAELGVGQQQQQFVNQLAQSRFGEEQRRTGVQEAREKRLLDQGRIEVVKDQRGNLTFIDREKLAKSFEGGKVGDALHTISTSTFKPADFDKEVEQLQKKFDVTLTGPEKAMLFQGVLDANDAQDVTPIRQTIQTIMTQRAADERSQRAAERPSYQPVFDPQGRITGTFNIRDRTVEPLPESQAGIFRKGAQPEAITNDIANGGAGLRATLNAERMLEKDSNLLTKAAIPGSLGARAFQAARDEMIDVKTRFRTGAALNEEEQKFYNRQAPGALDTGNPETIRFKFNLFKSLYRSKLDGLGAKVTYKVTLPSGAVTSRVLSRVDAEKSEAGGAKLEFVRVE